MDTVERSGGGVQHNEILGKTFRINPHRLQKQCKEKQRNIQQGRKIEPENKYEEKDQRETSQKNIRTRERKEQVRGEKKVQIVLGT